MSLQQTFQALQQQEQIDLPTGWLQGRTIYGGLVSGLMMQKAMLAVNDLQKRLLSSYVTFVGPVQEAPVRITAEILREGKSVTTVEVRLWQEGAVQSILIASFGAERYSEIHVHQERLAPDYATPEQWPLLPFNPLMPQCYQQFELVWAEGQFPCTGSQKPDFGGWFHFNPNLHENRAFTVADLMNFLDIWPPGVLSMFQQIAPASSLTWQVSYIHPIQHQLHDWFKYQVFTDYAENGYATEYAHLWDAENRLIAISRQTVTVFA